MIELFSDERFAVVVGVNWKKCLFGAALSFDQPDNARCGVIHFGPFLMHIIVHD